MLLTPQQAKSLADRFLNGPDPAPGAADAAPPAETIGNYRILHRIASGGMGTVYEAEQEHPHRTVALKVMKRGIASRSALRRFEYEAEILGRLRHPGIAQIYEAGTHDEGSGGVPFFAMEYVPNARNIIEYANAEGLSVRARLELLARVCDAVHHGHQKGVIHRDLKPGNILVDETGRPKVIDFGVARATDADLALTTIQTSVGELLGTLQYMSPEQCEANPDELDTRTDVYSLGVLLYELLCDQPPYDVSNTPLPKATRIIQEQEAVRPSVITRVCRGDLEAITLKALEKRPESRYQSAADLARDIRHHLNGEPTEARPPTTWTRWARWIGRHPIASTVAACLAIALATVGLTVGSVWWLSKRPYQIEVTADGREARLVSVAGAIIHTWPSDADGGIAYATMIEQAPALGGERLVLIGYTADAKVEQHGSLCAFTLRNLNTPVWTARVTQSDIGVSPLPDTFTEDQFHVTCGRDADVFPERPGREIIAIHKDGPYSPVALRIYDLNGELLYQIWHDGVLNPPCWLAEERLLVMAGLGQEKLWPARGYPAVNNPLLVAFAVRPRAGHLGRAWTGDSEDADTATLAWYKCVLPPAYSDTFSWAEVTAPHAGEDASRFLRFGVALRGDDTAAISWLMTGSGDLVPGSEVPTDSYKRHQKQGRAPAPELVKLGELPPAGPPTK
jgi:serine/threonine protein kinase